MTIQQIKYFLEVAKTHKFTTAASNLFVAQSSLSYAIHEMEHELGVPLFVRNSKTVTLTDYGENYLPYAEQILAILETGDAALKSMRDPLSGTVKLGFFYCVSNSEIPRIFRKFYTDNPKSNIFLDFAINQGNGAIDDQLLTGTYDLVVSTSNEVIGCETRKIGQQSLIVLVADNHPLASKDVVSMREIANEPILSLNPNSNLDRWIRSMFADMGIKPDISYCPDWMTQFGYVAMNYGIAITPSMPLFKEYTKELKIEGEHKVWRDLYLIWPKNRKLTNAAKYVRDYIINFTTANELNV